MGIEEKAKAYDEALEKAKVHINNKGIGDTVDLCKHLFPELRESKDERVIKALEAFINQPEIADKITFEARIEWLSWLEKQKEPTKEELYAEAGTTENEYIANTMKMVRAMREKQKEPKPAEWSEEEIGHLYTLARYIKSKGYEDDGEFLEGVANKLKSLRPSWKPSDEAVEGLFQNTPFPTICLDDCKEYNFKDGDKVRIIIVKED